MSSCCKVKDNLKFKILYRVPDFEWSRPTSHGNPMREHFPNWHIEVTISLKDATEKYGALDTIDIISYLN